MKKVTKVTLAAATMMGTQAVHAETGFIELDGGERLFYETQGTGDKVIIAGAHMYVWDWAKSLADDEWTVVGFDARSRGKSSYVEASDTLNLDQDVQDLERLRQHLGAEKISLVGFSFTGKIATQYAMTYPDRVERVVQIASAPVDFGRRWKEGFAAPQDYPAWAAERARPFGERRSRDEHVSDAKNYCIDEKSFAQMFWVHDANNGDVMRPLAESLCQNYNEWPVHLTRYIEHHGLSVRSALFDLADLARVSMPVLAIHGKQDRNAPIGGAREWAWRLPDARLISLDGAAHYPFVEKAPEITSYVKTFLGGAWPDQAIVVNDAPFLDGEESPD